MDGKGNGHVSSFRTSTGVPKPSFPLHPRPKSTPPPLTRAMTQPAAPVTHTRPEPARHPPSYGIARAVELLRRLPAGDRALLVEVVTMALESANVQVETIIDDATKRGAEIDARIAVLRAEVAQREEEIATRREEIASLETEQDEISQVKQQLTATREPPMDEKPPSNDEDPLAEIEEAPLAETDELQTTLNALQLT